MPLYNPVTDATLTTSDITTNDVSTTKHGFAPKVTDVSKFLKGDGTWATVTASTPDTIVTRNVTIADTTVAASYAAYVPDELEVGNTFFFELASTGILEIG